MNSSEIGGKADSLAKGDCNKSNYPQSDMLQASNCRIAQSRALPDWIAKFDNQLPESLADWRIAELTPSAIAGLPDCRIVGLPDCRIAGLPDCAISGLGDCLGLADRSFFNIRGRQ